MSTWQEELIGEVRGLRGDVQTERKGRKWSFRVIAAAFLLAAMVASGGVANYVAEQDAKTQQTCESRVQGRHDLRGMAVADIDYLAKKSTKLTAADRRRIHDDINTLNLRRFPDPIC